MRRGRKRNGIRKIIYRVVQV
jgi:hypothetical protein